MIKTIDAFLATLAIKLIRVYQITLSPDHGLFKKPFGYCRFQPTCSDYCLTAFNKYGFIRGGMKCSARIARCNPFNSGGWDPLK
jgi:putative membrane protein insertion efficiency factor